MLKRVMDVTLGTLLLVLTLPLVLVLALALAVELRAFPFFVQDRLGEGGRTFRFLKLRTLPPTTPRYALKGDLEPASLSRFRAFLRAQHLDELPQLVHVVTGRLSLVGPRPRMPDEHEPVEATYARWRVLVPQGCTGMWQIGAHTDELPSDHPEYDLFYLRHRSVRLDLWILWRTALQALGIATGVTLREVPARLLADHPLPDVTIAVPEVQQTTSIAPGPRPAETVAPQASHASP